jgi:ubiquinone/menaquinone biosynthesis C-methylase UbiE
LDDFVAVKLRWLMHRYPHLRSENQTFRLLDYGCGTAPLLRLIAEADLRIALVGCDVSTAMLDQATTRWPADIPLPTFCRQDGAKTPLPDGSIDLAVINAVLHHVLPSDRPDVYAELHRVLVPGGRLVVFEHNPLNPVTRYVVAHTLIDQNAILLWPNEVRAAVQRAQFEDIRTRYLMFMPPRFAMLASVDYHLGRLPFGAQYVVTASAGDRLSVLSPPNK